MPIPPCTCWAVAATRAPASARPELRDAGLPAGPAALAEEPGGLPHGPADRLDVDERVGHPLLHGLEASDRPAELLAFGRVRGGDAQRTLRYTELDRAQPDERAGVQRVDHLLAVAGKPVFTGNDCTVEDYIGVRLAIGRHRGPNVDTDGVRVEQEEADVTVVDLWPG